MAIGGSLGLVDGSISVRNWTISESSSVPETWHSSSLGMVTNFNGNKDWTGGYSQYFEEPTNWPGDEISFVGSMEDALGVGGDCIIDSINIVWDVAGCRPVVIDTAFSGNGALSRADTTDVTDGAQTATPSAGCYITIMEALTGEAYAEIPGIQNITFNISCSNQAYASSATSGIIKRLKGNWNANLAIGLVIDRSCQDINDLPVINSLYKVKIIQADASYWDIQAIRFSGVTNVTVDVEQPNVVTGTLNGMFTGTWWDTDDCVNGVIVPPSLSQWWPEE